MPVLGSVSDLLLADPHGEYPIRAELFGLDHLENHARLLGERMGKTEFAVGRPLLTRFQQNARALRQAHRTVSQAYHDRETLSHDAEWLLDNYHIISEALAEVTTDLPRGYYRWLPKLIDGPLAGFPRVYALALELIAHCDSSLDETNVSRFIQAFQTVAPLSIGELWAMLIMLRLCLVDNLRRLAEQIVQHRDCRLQARKWVDANLPSIEASLEHGRFTLDQLHPDWHDCYLAHLMESLYEHELTYPKAADQLHNSLNELGHAATDVLRREKERQAANQVSIGNCVTALRLLSALDWSRFFEKTSLVEAILRRDPAGAYPRQDFSTRDRYRQMIEHLARRSDHSELDIAETVLAMAASQPTIETPTRRRHIGFYLIDEGRPALEDRIGYRPPPSVWFQRQLLRRPRAWYFGGLTTFTLAMLAGLAVMATWLGAGAGLTVLLLFLALIPTTELALGLLNLLAPTLIPPRVLPRIDYRDGVPPDCATFVVIPTLLTSPDTARNLVERLEIHYLSNPDEQLYFGLLTDFADAATETTPDDSACLQAAEETIQALNAKHAETDRPRFFLFHRQRLWNPLEKCWMGWERKRGKLAEFNRLLRHDEIGSLSSVTGDLSLLPPIRYVITLDSDTQLPREAARKLIATLAHPLNQPRFDPSQGCVVRGYGVLQPRISLSLRGARRSLLARIFTGSAGIDPYTTAVSDTYQDLFGCGSFTGKGIYDLDAFEQATGHVFPDNRILSHDLLEGNYARCGLVSDVELFDDFPTHYLAYARREHRWARGDWQIMSWLFGKVPGPDGKTMANPLPLVERWKIFDNLRRSLVGPSAIAVLLLGWTVLPGPAWWTGFVVLILAWPLVLNLTAWPFRALRHVIRGMPRLPAVIDLGSTAGQVLTNGIFLLEQARSMVDAIGRTLYRLCISHQHLLEWEAAAATERRLGTSLELFLRALWPAALASALVGGLLVAIAPQALIAASPFLAGWLLAPLAAWWISQPRREARADLTVEERGLLRRWARKTWSFFETFVHEEDHWLPPDNYQEDPKGEVAHRTSPTNIGLYLLSCVAAHDLGYLTLSAMLERLEKAFKTLQTMERAHGHFYNWYDTTTLAALHPIYLSTVDSGNLAASLVTLKQGLLEKTRVPLWGSPLAQGLVDALELVRDGFATVEAQFPGTDSQSVKGRFAPLLALLLEVPATAPQWNAWLAKIVALATTIHEDAVRLVRSNEKESAWLLWSERLVMLARERSDEFNLCLADSGPESTLDPRYVTLDQLIATIGSPAADREAVALRDRCLQIGSDADDMAAAMDFRLLYNADRDLFAVGYNLTLSRIDNAHYDLLASEAALTSFLAVARGDVPRRHWFHLGRPLARVEGDLVLLSWGGTMFEYLMPRLFLHLYPDTLLEESQHAAVAAQIHYGRRFRAPWGISESAYNAVDGQWNYQYQAFGVPGLGLKRGLGQDLVVAPYATGLAVMVAPDKAVRNYRRLCQEGAEGRYGLFEAIDYTADRLPQNRSSAIVKCFMAHHQGMTLLALENCLLGNPVARRFHAEPMVRATELLLQERVPRDPPLAEPQATESAVRPSFQASSPQLSRRLTTPHSAHPRTHLLASEHYSLMVTNAGSGQSSARGLAVTRWREDRTCDGWGQFYYVRDLRSGACWSAGHQPLAVEADEYEVTFATDQVVFRRVDDRLETRMEITISPENHAEVRRLSFANHDSVSRYLEITSYAEVVLAPQAADMAHPAFGKLFVETEYLPATETLLCRRRPRAPEEKPIWGMHVLASEGQTFGTAQCETDRARFLGRGRTAANPRAIDADAGPLSGTTGAVLDPIFSLRRRIRVKAGASVSLAFTTALAQTREEALVLADHYHDYHGINRAFELAWAHGQVELRQLHVTAGDTHLFQRLAAHVIYAGPAFRAPAGIIAANRQGQAALWRQGISGDLPIVLAFIGDADELPFARQLIAAHAFWRLKGLTADLVIINEQDGGYFEDFQQQIQALVRGSEDRGLIDKPGGTYIRKATHLSAEERTLLQAVARCVLFGGKGALAAQLDRLERPASPARKRPVPAPLTSAGKAGAADHAPPLQFDNGYGGFTPDGKEYIVRLPVVEGRLALPPRPWINVIANANFGTVVSESGGGFTWARNSQSNRMTPWQNDPVSDAPGEIIYLRDSKSGHIWTATPHPLGGAGFKVRHGQGYTIFEQTRDNLLCELTVFVPGDAPLKVMRLSIRNSGDRARSLTATFFAELVLGRTRESAAPHIVTEIDSESGAILARSAFRPDEPNRITFADTNIRPRALTADRTEFLGRNGSVAAPAALDHGNLSGKIGAALDPCAALHANVVVPAQGAVEVIFLLGEANDLGEVRQLVAQYRDAAKVQAAWIATTRSWEQLLSALTIKTPDPALDLLVNRWLPYQVLGCRMWARSALYQSGGAYGFRDQLQDCLALLYACPNEAREHLLRAAARQFVEGDVQHWWHPLSGAGVRTRFSDDYLWLPFAVEQYVRVTGDRGVLDERIPFLQAPRLNPGQDEDYRVPNRSDESGTLYEHCVRALDHGFRLGSHGLPLMGTGDWNDGMNRVGSEGRGESVWTGWFLLKIARDFAALCETRGEKNRASQYRDGSEGLRKNLEEHAWDGEWYRRAYFDDGQPLGSGVNDECRIDSIAQSWAVISGAGDPKRARQALDAVERELIRRKDKLVLLFTPPFDHGALQPGYIKGYVPGIRENGGQYTHAALWVAQAFALLGRGEQAMAILELLNPIRHATTPADADRYQIEPYVVAADVYSESQHVGLGGWSWYTGSAAWFYRVVVETVLGFEKRGTQLQMQPRIPDGWPGYELTFRQGSAIYRVRVARKPAGEEVPPIPAITLVDDGREHEIVIYLPQTPG